MSWKRRNTKNLPTTTFSEEQHLFEDGRPVVFVARIEDTFSFWCDYCSYIHSHGMIEGHRIAHCINMASPYRDGGYVLKEIL